MQSWQPIYRELAESILTFQNRQPELISFLRSVPSMDAMINLHDQVVQDKETDLTEIDPFTFFASFNKGLKAEKRIAILQHLKERLGLTSSLPTEFNGIPTVNSQNAWFFPFGFERDPGDIPALWNLAAKALTDVEAIRPEDFDRCLGIKQVGLTKLTQGLFWLAPQDFIATDKHNGGYLKLHHEIELPKPTWMDYSKFLNKVAQQAGNDFSSLSMDAWNESQTKAKQFKSEIDQVPTIYKISHGADHFPPHRLSELSAQRLVVVHKNTKRKGGKRFSEEINIGDVIYIRQGNEGIHHLGRITSDAQPCPTQGEGWLQRKYKLIAESENPGQGYVGPNRGWAPIYNSTCAPVRRKQLQEFEEYLLKPFFELNLLDLAKEDAISPQPLHSKDMIIENKIFYGPPGTGKTWHIQQQLSKFSEHQAVQTRGEFCQELVSGKSWWLVIAAALHDLKRGKVREILDHELVQARLRDSQNNNPTQTIWGNLQSHSSPDDERVKYRYRQEPYIFRKGKESTWETIPKSISEECSEVIEVVNKFRSGEPQARLKKRYSFITFHQSYSYEEFVEGIRPVMDDDIDDNGSIRYQVTKGAFREICDRAAADPGVPYALFIDEINRGNISKIFGELITLVELDKREGSECSIEVKLPYSHDLFTVPANLCIYGTMNTADRSLAQLDIALRRRFTFEEMMPKSELLNGIVVDGIDIKKMLDTVNQRIELLYDREHTLGHSFFMKLRDDRTLEHLARIMEQEILPLLEEYFFEDWEKIRLVLGDHQKPKSLAFIQEKYNAGQIDDLLGKDVDHAGTVYERNSDSFTNPEAYKGIYQSARAL